MKDLSPELKAHFASELTTIASIWKITRRDGTIMGFTDHDQDILFDEVTYESSTGMSPTAIASKSDMSVDNLDVDGMLDSVISGEAITEADILAGVYDYSELEVAILNYSDLTQGKMIVRLGWLGEVTMKKGKFTAEIRGLNQKLLQNIGDVYTPSCRAILGDAKCTVDLEEFTFEGEITSVNTKQIFSSDDLDQPSSYFTGGEVEFTSGDNENLRMEVKEFRNGQVILALAMPNALQVGDTFNIIAGCDKSSSVCKAKFDNLINFRGFPNIPGGDKLYSTAGTIDRE